MCSTNVEYRPSLNILETRLVEIDKCLAISTRDYGDAFMNI